MQSDAVILGQPVLVRWKSRAQWASATDAVRQHIRLLQDSDIKQVLVLSGDQLYRMNYADLLATHEANGADVTIAGPANDRAARLRDAYVSTDAEARLAAMRGLWGEGDAGFSGQVLSAYAAARITPSEAYADDAADLIASMLTAGLDRDAASWRGVVEEGSIAWGLIAVADPDGGTVSSEALNLFAEDDGSDDARKTAFLVAGLAGLERFPASNAGTFDVDLSRQTRWTRTINQAAEFGNPALVALLVGLGMQGEDWSQMTPLHLYHITSALRRVGLEAEARMIAAEAVARG